MAIAEKLHQEKPSQDGRPVHAIVATAEARRILEDWSRSQGCKIQFHADRLALRAAKIEASTVVVVEAGDDSDATLGEIEALLLQRASRTDVIVLLAKQSGVATRRLFKAGAKDVVALPGGAADLSVALKSVLLDKPTSAALPVAGKIICVLKTAGGVGGTTISANMAREFTRFGIGEVGLFDLDMQFGGVDTALDISPPLNLTDAIVAADRLDGAMLRQMMSDHASGVRALASAKTIAPIDSMSEQFVRNLCQLAKSTFSVSILDMPMAWAPWFAAALASSDVIVPVVEPTVRSANGAMRIANALEDLELRAPAKTILPIANRATKVPNWRERLKMLEDILKAPCSIQIREDVRICSEAADVGRCLRDVAPGAAISLDFEFAARSAAKAAGLNISQAEAGDTGQRFVLPWRRQ